MNIGGWVSPVGLAVALLAAGVQVTEGVALERSRPVSREQNPIIANASTESLDGTYTGTITCEPLPTTTRLQTAFSITVEAGRVRYEREILQRGYKTGTFERGMGTVSDTGDVIVTGSAPSFEAEYKGQITGDRVHLEGTQYWQLPKRSKVHARPCQIDLAR